MPAVTQAQSGILHKRSYAPAPMLVPPGAAVAASVSNLPPDAVPGVVVEAPGIADSVPGFPGHGVPDLDGGTVVVPLPAQADLGEIVHIMPYPFNPGGQPPVSSMPGVKTTGAPVGPQTSAAARSFLPIPRALPQNGARGLPERAAGVRSAAIATPAAGAPSQTGAAAGRGPAAPNLQRVGVERAATPPRWRERLRFSWPGGGK
ncbi:MAG: hypothetical protein ACKOBP_00165 [Planctomycetia bacterium]